MPKKIIVKISDVKVKTIKKELRRIMESETDISIKQIQFGSLGDESVISFNIDDDHYQMIFERMKRLGAILLIPALKKANEKTVSKDINQQSAVTSVSFSNNSTINEKQGLSTISEKPSISKTLDTAINNGDYETLIKISKDIRNSPAFIKKAKDNINDTLTKEIEKVYELGEKSNISRKDSVERLTKISTDRDLKTMNKIDALKSAGLMAVKLCALSIDYISYLVKLCNSNAVPKIVSVKAAVALAELILPDLDQTTQELDYVVKYLNINWLNIAYDIVIVELSTDERDKFIHLVNAIKGKR